MGICRILMYLLSASTSSLLRREVVSRQPNREAILGLIGELEDMAEQSSSAKQYVLSPLPFATCWTSDETPWSKWGGYAGQRYGLDKSVVNAAEIPTGHVKVEGDFVQAGAEDYPNRYKVHIRRGSLRACWGLLNFPLPISGKGYLEVVYADDDVRVLRNFKDTEANISWEKSGSMAVQVELSKLSDEGADDFSRCFS